MITLNIQGMDYIAKRIQEAKIKYPLECKKGITLACMTIEKKAKQNCPVDTGRLRASITYSVGGDPKTINFKNRDSGLSNSVTGISVNSADFQWFGIVGTDVDYAPYVELGTKRMSAQPFLAPALYSSRAEIIKIFRDVLKGVKL